MQTKPEFHSIELFRKIRDQQAAALFGKTPAEIIAFFSKIQAKRIGGSRRQATRP